MNKLAHTHLHITLSQHRSYQTGSVIPSVSIDILFGSVSCCFVLDTQSRMAELRHRALLFLSPLGLIYDTALPSVSLRHHFSPNNTDFGQCASGQLLPFFSENVHTSGSKTSVLTYIINTTEYNTSILLFFLESLGTFRLPCLVK